MSPDENKRFALLGYTNTLNIGDEIQSLAVRRFLPKVDDIVDREQLDTFASLDGVSRKLILNGWFMHSPERWPPSELLDPLVISFHLSEEPGLFSGIVASQLLLAPEVQTFLKLHEPIGARDLNTLRLLKAAGIDSYFSGCVTLTLPKANVEKDNNLIVAIDASDRVIECIGKRTNKVVQKGTHLYFDKRNQDDRFSEAQDRLRLYERASCVVTSRLHCALPCLALGTPILFMENADDSYRFSGLRELLRCASEEEFLRDATLFDLNNPPPNKPDYLTLRQTIISRVEDFLRSNQPPRSLDLNARVKAIAYIKNVLSDKLVELRRENEAKKDGFRYFINRIKKKWNDRISN